MKTKINKCNPLENLSKRKRKNLVQINLRRKCIESKKFKKRKQDRLIQTKLPQLQKLKSRNMLQCQLRLQKKSLLKFLLSQRRSKERKTLITGKKQLRESTDLRLKRKRKLFKLTQLYSSNQRLLSRHSRLFNNHSYHLSSSLN